VNPSTSLSNMIILGVQKACAGNVRVFRRVVSKVHPIGQPHVVMQVGVVGQADLYGFAKSTGFDHRGSCLPAIPFEIEVKVAGDKEGTAQTAWRDLCAFMNIPHHVAYAKSRKDFPLATRDCVAWVMSLHAIR
jgi:hypothetical protein